MRLALIDSGVTGTAQCYADDDQHRYRIERIRANWQPCFDDDDVVLVPNGANHVALYAARAALHGVLARGGVLLCFCGFFMPWLPGHRWRHDFTRPLRALRYSIERDDLQLFEGVAAEELCVDAHGIRGGWACGEILAEHAEAIVLRDNYQRVLMVADHTSSAGLIIATASGPLFDDAPTQPASGARRVYRNILRACRAHLESRHA